MYLRVRLRRIAIALPSLLVRDPATWVAGVSRGVREVDDRCSMAAASPRREDWRSPEFERGGNGVYSAFNHSSLAKESGLQRNRDLHTCVHLISRMDSVTVLAVSLESFQGGC